MWRNFPCQPKSFAVASSSNINDLRGSSAKRLILLQTSYFGVGFWPKIPKIPLKLTWSDQKIVLGTSRGSTLSIFGPLWAKCPVPTKIYIWCRVVYQRFIWAGKKIAGSDHPFPIFRYFICILSKISNRNYIIMWKNPCKLPNTWRSHTYKIFSKLVSICALKFRLNIVNEYVSTIQEDTCKSVFIDENTNFHSLDVNNNERIEMPAKELCLDQCSFFLCTNGMSVIP